MVDGEKSEGGKSEPYLKACTPTARDPLAGEHGLEITGNADSASRETDITDDTGVILTGEADSISNQYYPHGEAKVVGKGGIAETNQTLRENQPPPPNRPKTD